MTRRWRSWAIRLSLVYFAAQIITILLFQFRRTDHAAVFGSFWEAGKHLDYLLHPLVFVSRSGMAETNLNPPVMMPLFQLFALVDPHLGQTIWLAISAALYLAALYALRAATTVQLVWLLTVPLVFNGLLLGQIYVLLFVLGVGIHVAIKAQRSDLAGLLFGVLVAMKPNFALWGLMAFVAGFRREAIVAGIVAAFLTTVPLLLYGAHIYRDWLAAVELDTHYLSPHDVSITGFLRRLDVPVRAFAVLAGVSVSVLWTWRNRDSLNLYDLTPIAYFASILSAPLAWMDYILVAAPFIVDRPWRMPMLSAAFIIYVYPFALDVDLTVIWQVGLASLICLTSVAIMLWEFVEQSRASRRQVEHDQTKMTSSTLSLAD